MKTLSMITAMTLALGACHVSAKSHIGEKASSALINNQGEVIGQVEYVQGNNGVIVSIDAKDLPAGKHGMHFHAKGSCKDHEHFKEAKGHIIRGDKPHGYLHPDGPHEGNLPNLIVHEDGSARVELYSELVSIRDESAAALLDEDGSAIIIHTNPDDHLTQPIGGAGARIACGVVKASE